MQSSCQGMHLARYTGPVLPAAIRPHTTSTLNFAAAVNSWSTMPEGYPVAIDVALVCRANVATSFGLDFETPREVLGDVSATGLPVWA